MDSDHEVTVDECMYRDYESVTSYVNPLCDWLKEAKFYNHNYEKISNDQLMDRVDALVLYFSMLNVDRFNIIHKFSQIHTNTRITCLPIEVINVPMDDNEKDMLKSYDEQANWFTLMYNDPLIPILQYRYGITSVPHLLVMRTDGTIVSSHGILDLDEYGKNALITWLSTSAISKNPRRLYKESSELDLSSAYLKTPKREYKRRFSILPKKVAIKDSKVEKDTNIFENIEAKDSKVEKDTNIVENIEA